MNVFLEHSSVWNMLNCAEQVQTQKYKTYAYKVPQTACGKSSSNIQLISKVGFRKKIYISINRINAHISNPDHKN